jgi:two-component system cell cycle sensor histidine kinase/response regulator CckA
MGEQLRVLLVEDSADDADLLLRELKRAGYDAVHERVWSAEGIISALGSASWDLVISDHGMPAFSGTEALLIVREHAPDVPFIFVSGSIGEDVAVAAMRAGAQDYVMKGNIRRLAPAIGRELKESESRRRERITEEQLRSTGELLRSVFAASPLAIIATNLDGLVTLWNPAAERLFGWTRDEVIGRENPVVPPQARESIEARRALAKQGEAFTDVEARRLKKDGKLVDVAVTIAATHDGAGRPDGVTVVYQDLTERKQLQAQFLQAQKMEAVGRLAGGVAHDFNNLLTVITSYADLLSATDAPAGTWREDLQEITRAAEAATGLTRQLLSFSRQRVIEPKVLDLNTVVTGATKLAGRLLGANIQMIVQLDPQTGAVKVDAGHIEQIVMNLAVNARDAMPRGGRLTITTHRVSAHEAHSGDPTDAPAIAYARLAVTDTGTGMDEATQLRIFEPFFTTKATDKGTGLGLATVYGLVKQYEGLVRVHSVIGKGTTFELFIPVARNTTPVEPVTAPGERPKAVGTILLVQDEPAVRSVARRMLENAGYSVIEAPDGQTALRIAESRPGAINLLITDTELDGAAAKLADHVLQLNTPVSPDELLKSVRDALK